jgi:hypothetical protein
MVGANLTENVVGIGCEFVKVNEQLVAKAALLPIIVLSA